MIVFIWFAFKYQKNIVSRYTFIVSLGIDILLGIVVLVMLLSQKGNSKYCNREESEDDIFLVPPPLSLLCHCICCSHPRNSCSSDINERTSLWEQCCMNCWTIFTNIVSLITFIASLSYLIQALPAIAISYYISPTASLIKLGFFELAVIILVVEIAFFLYLVDKCVWLSYVHCAKRIPDEVYEVEEISTKDHTPPPPPQDSPSPQDLTPPPVPQNIAQQPKKIKYIEEYLVDGTKAELISFGHWKCSCGKLCHWLFFTSAFQIIVAMLLIGISAPLLYFIMNIIIDQTSMSNDQFKDILAIIPTIALNTWLLIRYGNISHTIKEILGKATKSAMEHHDSHHSDEHLHHHHHGMAVPHGTGLIN